MAQAVSQVTARARIQDLGASFDRLWSQAAAEHKNLARAMTHNIVMVADADAEHAAAELITGILARHPCRALLILLDPQQTEPQAGLKAEVSDHHSSQLMVLEQLTLRVDYESYRLLPNLLRPLLEDDIPISLVWARALPDSLGRLASLAALCDRTVVDSALFDGDDWRSMRQLMRHPLFDLASLRLAPWRRSLAEAFEHFEWQPEVHETQVVIEHGPADAARNAARCLEAWLQLKLRARVRLERREEARAACVPEMLSLVHGPTKILLTNQHEAGQLRLDVTLGDYCRMPSFIRASQGSRADLLAAALDSRATLEWPEV